MVDFNSGKSDQLVDFVPPRDHSNSQKNKDVFELSEVSRYKLYSSNRIRFNWNCIIRQRPKIKKFSVKKNRSGIKTVIEGTVFTQTGSFMHLKLLKFQQPGVLFR